MVPGASGRVEDGPEVVLVWSPCDSSVIKAIQMFLEVACEYRPIQVISRILRRFRRQEVVPGGYRKVEDGPEVVLVWSPWNSSVMKAIQMVLDVAC